MNGSSTPFRAEQHITGQIFIEECFWLCGHNLFFYFLYLLFLFFSPTGGMTKLILIWCCIKFREFSENILWWKPAHAVTASPKKREDFFKFDVGYMWCCGSLYGFWLSVTAPDLGHDNMWVSQASIRLSAVWDTHAGLVPEKQDCSVFLMLCSISP